MRDIAPRNDIHLTVLKIHHVNAGIQQRPVARHVERQATHEPINAVQHAPVSDECDTSTRMGGHDRLDSAQHTL